MLSAFDDQIPQNQQPVVQDLVSVRVHWSLKIKVYGKYNVDELKKRMELLGLKTEEERKLYLKQMTRLQQAKFIQSGQVERNVTELMLILEKEIPLLIEGSKPSESKR
jgi:hypothetical protein